MAPAWIRLAAGRHYITNFDASSADSAAPRRNCGAAPFSSWRGAFARDDRTSGEARRSIGSSCDLPPSCEIQT